MNVERRPRGGEDGALTAPGGEVTHHDTARPHSPVVDTRTGLVMTPHDCEDRVWQANLDGFAEGLRVGAWGGYRQGWDERGHAEREAAEAEWQHMREIVLGTAREMGVRQRRGGDPHAVVNERARRGWTP